MRVKASWSPAAIGLGILTLWGASLPAQEKKPAQKKAPDLTTQLAASDPDFKIQGEYEGEVSNQGKYAAQVVAKGGGKFEVYFLSGGLPGVGWDARTRTKVAAATRDKVVALSGGWTGTISDGTLTGKTSS